MKVVSLRTGELEEVEVPKTFVLPYSKTDGVAVRTIEREHTDADANAVHRWLFLSGYALPAEDSDDEGEDEDSDEEDEDADEPEQADFGYCPTGKGGGVDNSCGLRSGWSRAGLKSVAMKKSAERAFEGEPIAIRRKLSKLQTGELGEAIAISFLRKTGVDADKLLHTSKRNNLPADVIHSKGVVEVKAGLVSNRSDAQKWRLTKGEPGPKEKEWLKKASPAAKLKWNKRKEELIVERKKELVSRLSKQLGRRLSLSTVTVLLNPDKKIADVYTFPGVHPVIRWKSDLADQAYAGSFRYN